jgi:hypothetical protein
LLNKKIQQTIDGYIYIDIYYEVKVLRKCYIYLYTNIELIQFSEKLKWQKTSKTLQQSLNQSLNYKRKQLSWSRNNWLDSRTVNNNGEYRKLNIRRKDVGTRPSYPRQIEDLNPFAIRIDNQKESQPSFQFSFSKNNWGRRQKTRVIRVLRKYNSPVGIKKKIFPLI